LKSERAHEREEERVSAHEREREREQKFCGRTTVTMPAVTMLC